jgi:hypothetical protein
MEKPLFEQLIEKIVRNRNLNGGKSPDYIILGYETRQRLFAEDKPDYMNMGLPYKFYGLPIAMSEVENEMAVCYKGEF